MIAWMLYSVAVGLCVVAAAAAGDVLLRMGRLPIRFVWIVAVLVSLALGAIAPLRARHSRNATGAEVDLSSLAIVQTSIQSVEQHVPATGKYLAGLWALATVLVAGSFIVVYARMHRARRAWPMVDLEGHRVRLSPDAGPIVMGLVRPEIIVPRWVLLRSREEQRVILNHELAHVEASDPILLGIVCVFVALMPWNPALWICLERLRLAIELDCDARVLRAGVSPRSYGTLLVDVAERASRMRFAATALADDASHLHQRILAMQSRRFSHPMLRGASAAFVGLAALLVACDAKMPTARDVEQMDAQSAESQAKSLGLVRRDTAILWSVDGVVTTAASAKVIRADRIAKVDVRKEGSGSSHIFITTKDRQELAPPTIDSVRVTLSPEQRARQLREIQEAASHQSGPIVFVDGARSDPAVLKTMDRARIDRVEVLKG
ncbi:MAG TPA: M56 family metallopeptidase, partial [Gemmatimonadaceae bacterium]|nr:M56 family metallopeptidase [Gemmatimonadaceae bacterium]